MTRLAVVDCGRQEGGRRWEVMAMGATDTLPVRLQRLLEPVVRESGLDLEAVEVTPAGRRRVLRVVVDRDGGIDLDGVADISHAVSEALDSSDVMGGQAYVLEVTSPGTDRPLTEPRHWRRALGRLVKVELADGTTRTERVSSAGDDAADLEGGPVRYSDVRRARVEVEFSRVDPVEEADVAEEVRALQGELQREED